MGASQIRHKAKMHEGLRGIWLAQRGQGPWRRGGGKRLGQFKMKAEFPDAEVQDSPDGDGGDDLVPEGKLVLCADRRFQVVLSA